MTEELCNQCKNFYAQGVYGRLGYPVNCCAYGCVKRLEGVEYCGRELVVKYIVELIEEVLERKKHESLPNQ